jgi:hypothetical protein
MRGQVEMTQRDDIEEAYRDFACLNFNTMGPAEYESHTWVYDPDNGPYLCYCLCLLVRSLPSCSG